MSSFSLTTSPIVSASVFISSLSLSSDLSIMYDILNEQPVYCQALQQKLSFQIPPHPPFSKGRKLISPFEKGGVRGIFMPLCEPLTHDGLSNKILAQCLCLVRKLHTSHAIQGTY